MRAIFLVIPLALAATPALPESREARKARILPPTTDFTQAERFETLQGGSGTQDADGRRAFSLPSAKLSFEQRADFDLGEAVFQRPWVVAPSATRAADGLGPYYNARACSACHAGNGRGHPPGPDSRNLVSMVFNLRDADGAPDPVFGGQFQDQAVIGMAAEGRVEVSYEPVPFTYPDGSVTELRRPVYSTEAPLSPGVALNPRIAPQMIGLGLLEAIDAADILAAADPDDANGDGISGRAHILPDDSLGRFGWKATSATVEHISAAAFLNDIGMSTPLFPAAWGDCTEAQSLCRDAPHGDADGNPEITGDLLRLVSYFAANVAVPARPAPDEVLPGKALFYESGCIACHTPKHATAADAAPELRNQLIWPYTDLLLHDLGPGLADPSPTAAEQPGEWRTPPLWGIGHTEAVSGEAFFLHDGRARTLEEAVLWHGGEAASAQAAFTELSADDRAELLRFLESL